MYVYCLCGDDEPLQFGCWIQCLLFCGPVVFFTNRGDTCPFLEVVTPERIPWAVEQCLLEDGNQWSCLALFLLVHQHTSKALTLLPFSLCCLWLNRYHLLSCILPALHILWNFSSYPVSREGRKEVVGSVDRNWHEVVTVHHCRHHHAHPTWSASLIFENCTVLYFSIVIIFPFYDPRFF